MRLRVGMEEMSLPPCSHILAPYWKSPIVRDRPMLALPPNLGQLCELALQPHATMSHTPVESLNARRAADCAVSPHVVPR